jgi:mercuric ion binding protein
MKKGLLLLFALMLLQTVNAQEKKSKLETVIIQTSAECGDCKDRIEEMLNYTKGVKYSELDLETKKVTVKFSPKKISLSQIKVKLSELGYNADEVKSNPESVKKLPLCCQPGGMNNH